MIGFGKVAWISWESHRRSKELSRHFGADYFEILSRHTNIRKYISLCARTIPLLWAARGRVVVIQTPSTVLALLSVALRALLRYFLILDAHNAALDPPCKNSLLRSLLLRYTVGSADITLVTNENLVPLVARSGGTGAVLPDPLPDILPAGAPVSSLSAPPHKHRILFICSWAPDEPHEEVIAAAASLSNDHLIIATGDHSRTNLRKLRLPPNLILTGFVDEASYDTLLRTSDVILDLTTRADCLVCGAYEGLTLGKPVIVSDSDAVRKTFQGGVIRTMNDAASIARAIAHVCADLEGARSAAGAAKEAYQHLWTKHFLAMQSDVRIRLADDFLPN